MKVLNNSTNCTLSERQLEGICSQSSMAIIKNLKWERKRNYTVSEPFYKYCDDNVLIIEQRSVWYTWNLNNLNVILTHQTIYVDIRKKKLTKIEFHLKI